MTEQSGLNFPTSPTAQGIHRSELVIAIRAQHRVKSLRSLSSDGGEWDSCGNSAHS